MRLKNKRIVAFWDLGFAYNLKVQNDIRKKHAERYCLIHPNKRS